MYIIIMHHTFAVLTISICLSCTNASAGFTPTDQFRLYGCGLTDNINSLISYEELGYHTGTLFHTAGSRARRSTAKIAHESIVEQDLYKSTRTLNLQLVSGSPRIFGAGALEFVGIDIEVHQRTTLRLQYELDIDPGIDSSHEFFIRNSATDQIVVVIDENLSTSGIIDFELEAGSYAISDTITHTTRDVSLNGDWTLTSELSLTVVPAPTTLATLSPIGFLAFRRRR